MSDSSNTTTQLSGPESPPRDDGDVDTYAFNVGKVFGRATVRGTQEGVSSKVLGIMR